MSDYHISYKMKVPTLEFGIPLLCASVGVGCLMKPFRLGGHFFICSESLQDQ